MPPPITAQVATVRQSTSVPAKFQMASRQATTATRMQALVVQKEILVTILGFKKPLFIIVCGLAPLLLGTHGIDCKIGADRAQLGYCRDSQR